MSAIHVAKLGGSLLDLPDLVERFERWRATQMGTRGVLVVGGGAAADVVRHFDAAFKLGEARSHWLAIRAMQLNAHCTAAVISRCRLVSDERACRAAWEAGELAIIDPFPWLEREDAIGVAIPHRWTFTSDSVAAHIATRVGAAKLTMLKSTLPQEPPGVTKLPEASASKRRDNRAAEAEKSPDLRDQHRSGEACGVAMAAEWGIVDADFAAASAAIPEIEIVNLRETPPARRVLRAGA